MSRRWFLALAAVALVVGGFALASRPDSDALPAFAAVTPSLTPTPAVRIGRASITVRYTFDRGAASAITDVNGRHALRLLGENGGSVRLVPQGGGMAISYPGRCKLARVRDCPRAILEGSPTDDLNPGRRPLRYGASVRMTPADLADGANVVQKGFSVGGVSLYKLQVDHRLGHPSCVLAGAGRRIYRAEPWTNIADGKWHTLTCDRTGNRLSLSIDGVRRAEVPVPANLSITNDEPLRVGGKSTGSNNDQFAGEIDDVFITIGK